jgi:AcrR family transcriptional regulator
MKTQPKDRILISANNLFFKNGFTVGIDTIIRDSKVAKMSLYRHFKSKDALICAVIVEGRVALNARINDLEQASLHSPNEKLIKVFDEICCSFQNPKTSTGLCSQALMPCPEPYQSASRAALALKHWLLVTFQRLCSEAGMNGDSRLTAAHLMLIAEGCYGMSAVLGPERSCKVAHDLAVKIIEQEKLDSNMKDHAR